MCRMFLPNQYTNQMSVDMETYATYSLEKIEL